MGEWDVAAGKGEVPQLTRAHRVLIGVVVAGAVVIAGIGFAGSYAAVRELAIAKGFGNFSYVFPIGIDAGICVLLALDLLLTWIRIPFPLLRQTAWLLTVATIAFNGRLAGPAGRGHARGDPGPVRGRGRSRAPRDRPDRRHHGRQAHGGRPPHPLAPLAGPHVSA